MVPSERSEPGVSTNANVASSRQCHCRARVCSQGKVLVHVGADIVSTGLAVHEEVLQGVCNSTARRVPFEDRGNAIVQVQRAGTERGAQLDGASCRKIQIAIGADRPVDIERGSRRGSANADVAALREEERRGGGQGRAARVVERELTLSTG